MEHEKKINVWKYIPLQMKAIDSSMEFKEML